MRSRLALLLMPVLLAASGCISVGARPLAIGDRSRTDGHLETGGVGFEIAGLYDEMEYEGLGAHGVLGYMPLENDASGEEAHFVWGDLMLAMRLPLVDCDAEAPLYFRYELGPSLLATYFPEDRDGAGFGLCGRTALGWHPAECLRLEVFGDAHGWLGGDGEEFRAMWLGSLGAALTVTW
jgi:hypothetical protein